MCKLSACSHYVSLCSLTLAGFLHISHLCSFILTLLKGSACGMPTSWICLLNWAPWVTSLCSQPPCFPYAGSWIKPLSQQLWCSDVIAAAAARFRANCSGSRALAHGSRCRDGSRGEGVVICATQFQRNPILNTPTCGTHCPPASLPGLHRESAHVIGSTKRQLQVLTDFPLLGCQDTVTFKNKGT